VIIESMNFKDYTGCDCNRMITKKVIQELEWHYQKNKVVDRSIQ